MKEKIKNYLKTLPKRYFITAFSGMAQGLFVTLIAGTILAEVAKLIGENYIGNTLLTIANLAKLLMGAGIGVGIAHALGKNKLLIFAGAVAGMLGSFADYLLPSSTLTLSARLSICAAKGLPGNPIGAYVVTMFVIEIVTLYAGKTKLDILLIPLGALLLCFGGAFVAYPFIWLVNVLGKGIELATETAPFIMGIIIAVSMGIILTMPTSSAAIWASFATGNTSSAMLLAGGAATVGCACHMIGFAVASYRENKVGGLIAQGLGTSMLQIPNIMKKPVIMMPMIISSAILGPMSTCLFKIQCGASGGGMGTSGLVGVIDSLKYTTEPLGIIGIFLLMIVLPALLNWIIAEFMRKKNWIQDGDMKLAD